MTNPLDTEAGLCDSLGMIYDGMNEKGEIVNQTPEQTMARVREINEQTQKDREHQKRELQADMWAQFFIGALRCPAMKGNTILNSWDYASKIADDGLTRYNQIMAEEPSECGCECGDKPSSWMKY